MFLHIIASVNPVQGGPTEFLKQHILASVDKDLEIHVACLDMPDAPYVTDFPARVFAFGAGRTGSLWAKSPLARYGYEAGMVPWLQQNIHRYEAVIVHGLWNYSTMAARWVLPKSGKPYAVFVHGMLDPWFKKKYPLKNMFKQVFWLFCEGRLVNKADAVYFTTEEELSSSKNAFVPYKARGVVVNLGTSDVEAEKAENIAKFRAQLPRLGSRPYILFLSRIHPKKGLDLLINQFAVFSRQHPEFDLVLAGPDPIGWRHELHDMAVRLGIADRIHWPGMLTGAEKHGAFGGCAAFILPSHQENFGIAVAEALAFGKLVLISDKVQIWREIQSANAGIVKPDTNVGIHELFNEFTTLGSHDVAIMQSNARKLFLEKFEIKQSNANFVREIKQLALVD